ncbi:PXA domain-containing protein [Melampsora americana]|nr:PXA domain-containing protein [Melampsora americana]
MTLTGFKNNSNLDQDIRTRPRKRAREAINTSIGSSPIINSNHHSSSSSKPHSNPTASHPPLRRLFGSVPSPILTDKRYGNLLDPLLSNLLTIISKQFILTWYSQISPLKENSKPFITRVTQILIHIIRELEQRLTTLDVIQLILFDLPILINRHLLDLQETHCRLSFQRQRAIEPDLTFDEVFIRLRPHPGVQLTTVMASPNRHVSSFLSPHLVDPLPKYPTARALPSPTYLWLLIEALMERVLPAEDWAPETERLIIREILINVILAPLFCKLSEPATLYSLIAVHLSLPETDSQSAEPPSPSQTSPPISLPSRILGFLNRVIHFLLLLPSLYQSLTQLPPIGTRDDPNIFEPTLSLLATILGASQETHVRQLCWILGLFLRLFQNILTRLLVHLFYTTIISPISLSNLIVQITAILEQTIDPNQPNPREEEEIDTEKLREEAKKVIRDRIPNQFYEFCLNSKLDENFLNGIDEQTSNVFLMFDVLELLIVKVFPELAEWDEELNLDSTELN